MSRKVLSGAAMALAMLLAIPLAACSDGDPGLSRAEVQEIARAEVAGAPVPEPGLTRAEVEQTIQAALAGLPQPEPGVTMDQVEDAVRSAIAGLPEPEPGLSRAEVEQAVQAALVNLPEPPPGLTMDQVEAAVRSALADLPEPGLSRAEVQGIARDAVAFIPPRSAPADYTKFFVNNAISRYDSEGLDAALAYYSRIESVDGQWYTFIIDDNDQVVAHYDAHLIGEDLKGPIGTDANGYNFGPEMLSATGDGKWVSYVYRNPESGNIATGDLGDVELKNVWVVRHDGLLFASGWYINADDFTRRLVSIALDKFRSGGLQATVAYFARPESALAGLEAAIAYYNQAETVDGRWSAFIAADVSGRIVAHSDPTMIGGDLQELFGAGPIDVPEEGVWVTTDAVRMWVAQSGGFVFGSGWHRDDPEA